MGEVLNLNNLIVLAALGVAVYTDIKSKKVSNRFVVGLLTTGFLFQIINHGTPALWSIASSLFSAIALGLPLYLMRIFGGGDFKLLIAVSAFLEWKAIIVVTLSSFVWGAILGLLRVLLQGELKGVFANLFSIFLRNKVSTQKLHSMPFTVAILFGFLTHLTLAQVGWELI